MNKKIKIISILLISSSIYAEEMNQQTLQNFDIQLSLMTNKLHDIDEKLNMLFDGLNPLIMILNKENIRHQESYPTIQPSTNLASTINHKLSLSTENHAIIEEPSQEDHDSALIDNDPTTIDAMPLEDEATQNAAAITTENNEAPVQEFQEQQQPETAQPLMNEINNMPNETENELPKEATVLGENTATVM